MAEEKEMKSLTEVNPRDLDAVVDDIREISRIVGAERANEYERHAWSLVTVVAAVVAFMAYTDPQAVKEDMIGVTFLAGLATWRAFSNHAARSKRVFELSRRLQRDIGNLAYRYGW